MTVSKQDGSRYTVTCANTTLDILAELEKVAAGARLIEVEIENNDLVDTAGAAIVERRTVTMHFEYTHQEDQ